MVIVEDSFLRTVGGIGFKFYKLHLIGSDNCTIALGGLFVDYAINMPQEDIFMVFIDQSENLVTSKSFRVINIHYVTHFRIIIHEQLSPGITLEQDIQPILIFGNTLEQFGFTESLLQLQSIYRLKIHNSLLYLLCAKRTSSSLLNSSLNSKETPSKALLSIMPVSGSTTDLQ